MRASNNARKRRPTLEDRVAELLIRYELGHFDDKVRDRLALIFERAPSDSWQRLERACDHLNITGDDPASFFEDAST